MANGIKLDKKEKMRTIKLHRVKNNTPVLVAIDNISVVSYVHLNDNEKKTRIYLKQAFLNENLETVYSITVHETVESIEQMLNKE